MQDVLGGCLVHDGVHHTAVSSVRVVFPQHTLVPAQNTPAFSNNPPHAQHLPSTRLGRGARFHAAITCPLSVSTAGAALRTVANTASIAVVLDSSGTNTNRSGGGCFANQPPSPCVAAAAEPEPCMQVLLLADCVGVSVLRGTKKLCVSVFEGGWWSIVCFVVVVCMVVEHDCTTNMVKYVRGWFVCLFQPPSLSAASSSLCIPAPLLTQYNQYSPSNTPTHLHQVA